MDSFSPSWKAKVKYLWERMVGEESTSSGDLASEVLSYNPTGYWKCNDSGSTLVDSSGNGYHMTVVGTPTMQFSYLLPGDTDKYMRIVSTGDGASITSVLGTSPPLTGNWTLQIIFNPDQFGTNFHLLMSLGVATSETEANNMQFNLYSNTATPSLLTVMWETGAGVDITVAQGIAGYPNAQITRMVHVVKDGTANTLQFYGNGRKIGTTVSYTNEPTGGTGSLTFRIGADGFGTAQLRATFGHAAFFNGQKLSDAQILSLAMTAGLLW